MPTIPCPISITCPGSDSPISNFSSEALDHIEFGAPGFPIFIQDTPLPPPVGCDTCWPPGYFANGCAGFCFSIESQEAANACAAAQAFLCQYDKKFFPAAGPTAPEPDGPFYNNIQMCSFLCPDGSAFTWTVLPGAVVTGSQELSDRIAYEIACERAAQRHICLPALSKSCQGAPYFQTITVTSNFGPYTFTITSGSLPPGITLTQTGPKTAVLAGTPTAIGDYPFTLRVADNANNAMARSYVFHVMGITNASPLPQATENNAYLVNLVAAGGTAPYVFDLELGAFPAGITLDPITGVISGTPTTTGTFAVTLSITDAALNFCTKSFSLVCIPGSCPQNISDVDWQYITPHDIFPGVNAFFTPFDALGVATADVSGGSDGVTCFGYQASVEMSGDICNSAGPDYIVTLHRVITAAGIFDCVDGGGVHTISNLGTWVEINGVIQVPSVVQHIGDTTPSPYTDNYTFNIPTGATTNIKIVTRIIGQGTGHAVFTISPLTHP